MGEATEVDQEVKVMVQEVDQEVKVMVQEVEEQEIL
jgi:hypothetical protein